MASSTVLSEIKTLLRADELLLGAIFRVEEQGVTNALEIVKLSGASNRGVVYNYQKMIAAILEESLPNSASISRNAARSISRLIRNGETISIQTLNHLNARRQRMLFNCDTVVWSNINIDTKHFALRNLWIYCDVCRSRIY